MTAYAIPLIAGPQTLSIALAGKTYALKVYWNVPLGLWIMDIASQAGTPIIGGIPLITGADLLEQYEYLDLGGKLYAQTDTDALLPPTYDNLGSTGNLYFVTSP